MSLNNIIKRTKEIKREDISWNNTLLQVLRENHYWPSIQTKKFYNNNNLILLHNTYKRKDVVFTAKPTGNQFEDFLDETKLLRLITHDITPQIENVN